MQYLICAIFHHSNFSRVSKLSAYTLIDSRAEHLNQDFRCFTFSGVVKKRSDKRWQDKRSSRKETTTRLKTSFPKRDNLGIYHGLCCDCLRDLTNLFDCGYWFSCDLLIRSVLGS